MAEKGIDGAIGDAGPTEQAAGRAGTVERFWSDAEVDAESLMQTGDGWAVTDAEGRTWTWDAHGRWWTLDRRVDEEPVPPWLGPSPGEMTAERPHPDWDVSTMGQDDEGVSTVVDRHGLTWRWDPQLKQWSRERTPSEKAMARAGKPSTYGRWPGMPPEAPSQSTTSVEP